MVTRPRLVAKAEQSLTCERESIHTDKEKLERLNLQSRLKERMRLGFQSWFAIREV